MSRCAVIWCCLSHARVNRDDEIDCYRDIFKDIHPILEAPLDGEHQVWSRPTDHRFVCGSFCGIHETPVPTARTHRPPVSCVTWKARDLGRTRRKGICVLSDRYFLFHRPWRLGLIAKMQCQLEDRVQIEINCSVTGWMPLTNVGQLVQRPCRMVEKRGKGEFIES